VAGVDLNGTGVGKSTDPAVADPEHRRVIPGNTHAITAHSFLRAESPHAYQGRWEEFSWHNEAFAFHLQSVGRGGAGVQADHAELRRLIERYGASRENPLTRG